MARKFTLVDTSPIPDEAAIPDGLGPHGTSLWRRVMAEYNIDDVGSLELLAQVCAAADMVSRCRAHIDRDGEIVQTRTGIREHPALRSELSFRTFVIRGLGRLGVTLEPVRPMGRPPGNG